ncbi:MAG: terminase large subunit [Pelagibacterium sp.]|uniref:terminase large subunit n=1 Tax=Pelagibacterium sp. TaxID=1967288 RepID=UPI0032ED0670
MTKTPSANLISDTYPHWIYDGSEIDDPFGYGERAVRFLKLFRHPNSTRPGQQSHLDPWQERIVRRIYGPRFPDGRRVVRNVVLLVPRGARKTSLGAALALLHTFGPERRQNGQVLSAAADREQARISFEEAMGIVDLTPQLAAVARPMSYRNRMKHPKSGSTFEAASADASTKHGKTTSFALIDELHAHPKRELYDVIRSGMRKVSNTLMVVATTAGKGQTNVGWEVIEYARKVARGEIENPAWLPILFEPAADADWRDEALWHAVNPGLALGYPDLEGLREAAKEAEHSPAERDVFKNLNLNFWQDASTSPFVDMHVYDKGKDTFDLDDMESLPCWVAVDLSSTIDLTAVVAVWRDGPTFYVKPFFYCPADNLAEREGQSQAPYRRWAEEGLVTATAGNVVDYDAVYNCIVELADRFDVREVAFDPKFARQVQPRVAEAGITTIDHPQQSRFMIPAIAALDRAILSGNMVHAGHEVLRWNFENVQVRTDLEGHKVALQKGKRFLSIDGAQATAMAVGRASEYETVSWLDDVDVDDFFAGLGAE